MRIRDRLKYRKTVKRKGDKTDRDAEMEWNEEKFNGYQQEVIYFDHELGIKACRGWRTMRCNHPWSGREVAVIPERCQINIIQFLLQAALGSDDVSTSYSIDAHLEVSKGTKKIHRNYGITNSHKRNVVYIVVWHEQ